MADRGTDLDAAWAAYGERYPGLRSLIEQTVRRTYADCDDAREARLNARAEEREAVLRAEARARGPFDCSTGFAARRGSVAPAPGPAVLSHGAPVARNAAANTVED